MNLSLSLDSFRAQQKRWPKEGRHILAQYDDDRVVVYQAYRPSIGHYAIAHQRFGGDFKMDRMTWIKPNFLWMMYRCGWAQKEGQEVVLAIHLRRSRFDAILHDAVHSSFVPGVYGTREQWADRVKRSSVRLQWDPDHAPNGAKQERRAVQLGIRGPAVREYVDDVLRIEDATPFVVEQHAHLDNLDALLTPREHVYPVADAEVAARLGVD